MFDYELIFDYVADIRCSIFINLRGLTTTCVSLLIIHMDFVRSKQVLNNGRYYMEYMYMVGASFTVTGPF